MIVTRYGTHSSIFFSFRLHSQHVRRAAVLALSTAAHNKPNLIKGLLPELLPLLYDQTVIKVLFFVCYVKYIVSDI